MKRLGKVIQAGIASIMVYFALSFDSSAEFLWAAAVFNGLLALSPYDE